MKNEAGFLSQKAIPVAERLIFALDFPDATEAQRWVNELGDAVRFYKVGLELFMAEGYFEFIRRLRGAGKRVFVDLKLFDVPQTVRSAVRQLRKHDIDFTTVHGDDNILRAAVEEKGDLRILAVTALTSLGQADMEDLGFMADTKKIVLSRAQRALEIGCDGVVSSGIEVPALRAGLGARLIVVTPGIRPVENVDDQKRTVDVEEAFAGGADYIVVGRPIRAHRGFDSPRAAAEAMQKRIRALFAPPVR